MCVLLFFFFQRAVVDAAVNLLQRLFRGAQLASTSSLVGALLMAQLFDSAECVDVVAHDDAVAIADVVALANGDATRDVSLVVVVSALAFALLVSLIACFYLCVLQKRKRDRDVERGSSRPPPPTAAASATASTARGSTDEDVDDKAPSNANT